MSNSDGEEIRTIDLLNEEEDEDENAEDDDGHAVQAGVNRAVWDLTHDGPTPVQDEEPPAGFFGPPTGPRVAPGTYAVR